jgi:hypothetical membrane protein
MRALAFAGIIGPVIFTATVILQSLRHSAYSDVALPISALAAFPSGWIQNVNFVVLGVFMAACAIGLHKGIRTNQTPFFGPALLIVSALGLIVAGAFPWRREGVGFTVPAGHVAAAFMAFLGASGGLFTLSRRMRIDPRWSDLAAFTATSGLAIAAVFLTIGVFARSDNAPLHSWAGLLQRVAVLLWFACTMILALRLLKIANSHRKSRAAA